MPLDGHQYLVSQGWAGKGTGLRQGAITRPIAVSQKKTLAGLGKDRDEAFPFWDHLFSAASKSIQVKISNDSDDSDADTADDGSAPILKRTTTGILSNRRPATETPATTSGTSTPVTPPLDGPRMSLIALAKREAAKRNLYSRFYRGPILGPDLPEQRPSSSRTRSQSPAEMGNDDDGEKKVQRSEKKKRKGEDLEKEEKRERKRRKKELKALEKLEKKAKKMASKEASAETEDASDCADKLERRRRREEKRKRREEKSTRKLEIQVSVTKETESKINDEAGGQSPEADDDSAKLGIKRRKNKDDVLNESTFPKAKKKRKKDD
ncbi:hypothetical protein V5O48_001391 [Marasmius crinis-equi]|uniref:G-patch domain-containing protein n=1 Tax=Marasmius crinis-equi TaxID=585013 RepID=A0ABR3FYQ4_9AGAR